MTQYVRRKFDRLYWKLADRVIPGQVNAQRPYLKTLDSLLAKDTTWLDLGCGHRLVPSWLPDADERQRQLVNRAGIVVGIDCDLPSLIRGRAVSSRALANVDHLPFADNTFDLVTANMVVEHLDRPRSTLEQIRRVLKPGGVFLYHTPNRNNPLTRAASLVPQALKNPIIRFLEGRNAHDVFPTHYRMNTPAAIRRLADDTGFYVKRLDLLTSSAETLMLGPLVVFEMALIRLTRMHAMRGLRSNMVVALQKPRPQAAKPTGDVLVADNPPQVARAA